jgi:membrane fusion protein (multidrug efflux system)
VRLFVLAGLVAVTGACREKAPPASRANAPIEVGTVTIEPQRVMLTTELPGRTSAFRVAEVRARVDGIVLKRLYEEGSDVKEGQPLFQIDPAPFRAALQSARAQLAGAQATEVSATLLAERYSKLVRTRSISRQEYDNAVAQQGSARANVAAARAAVTTAQINLGYTLVRSPIAGRSGPSNVTEGAYVQQAQATLLTSVTQLDPIYMDTAWPTLELTRVRRELRQGQLVTSGGNPEVVVVLEDGSEHPYRGTLLLTGVRVDPTTGSVALRALVPNPDRELLPGMFVRARIQEGTAPGALLVPQRAVTRDPQGRATALVVGAGGKVELRRLETERAVDESWLVTKGIAAGDHVIVEGQQKVQPGATVKMVPVGPTRQARGPRGT